MKFFHHYVSICLYIDNIIYRCSSKKLPTDADIFNKFKDGNHQTFKKSLQSDVSGLLSLYEATHLRVHGEEILEEALAFTTTHLESIKHNLSPPLSNLVSHSLNQPLRTGVARVEARHYLSIYQDCDSHNETLLTLAKLDFNLVQQLHQKELCEITRLTIKLHEYLSKWNKSSCMFMFT